MEATKLLEDMKRMQKSVSRGRFKGKQQTKGDFIKKQNRYTCIYCQGKTDSKKLRTSVEKFHTVKENDTLKSISDFYQTKPSLLKEINTHLNLDRLSKGDFVKLATDFKVFPNTHGICYCEKCANEKQKMKMSHVDYLMHVLKTRKENRNLVNNSVRRRIFERDNYKCVYCIKEYGKTKPNAYLTVDHKKAIVSGGETSDDNLCTSCLEHNQDKGSLSYDQYLKKIKDRKFLKENSVLQQTSFLS